MYFFLFSHLLLRGNRYEQKEESPQLENMTSLAICNLQERDVSNLSTPPDEVSIVFLVVFAENRVLLAALNSQYALSFGV
jgi:hypothetical protein